MFVKIEERMKQIREERAAKKSATKTIPVEAEEKVEKVEVKVAKKTTKKTTTKKTSTKKKTTTKKAKKEES